MDGDGVFGGGVGPDIVHDFVLALARGFFVGKDDFETVPFGAGGLFLADIDVDIPCQIVHEGSTGGEIVGVEDGDTGTEDGASVFIVLLVLAFLVGTEATLALLVHFTETGDTIDTEDKGGGGFDFLTDLFDLIAYFLEELFVVLLDELLVPFQFPGGGGGHGGFYGRAEERTGDGFLHIGVGDGMGELAIAINLLGTAVEETVHIDSKDRDGVREGFIDTLFEITAVPVIKVFDAHFF